MLRILQKCVWGIQHEHVTCQEWYLRYHHVCLGIPVFFLIAFNWFSACVKRKSSFPSFQVHHSSLSWGSSFPRLWNHCLSLCFNCFVFFFILLKTFHGLVELHPSHSIKWAFRVASGHICYISHLDQTVVSAMNCIPATSPVLYHSPCIRLSCFSANHWLTKWLAFFPPSH